MTHAPQPTVVVGVEETAGSRTTIRVAAQEARYRGASLIAVMAYGTNPALGAPAARPLATMHTADDGRLAAESALNGALGDALREQAGQVTRQVVAGPTGRALVEVAGASGAQLIVLGGHGATSLLPGGVTQHVLRKAPCPVLIVPEAGQVTAAAEATARADGR